MNIVKPIKKSVSIGRKLLFYRQHPEAALRYIPIVKLLKKLKLDKSKILEVGSGSYGITPYLKRKVTGLDTSFDEPTYPLLKQIKGSAEKIPFKAKKFDVVILSDVLEHMPKKVRKSCLLEAVRVSSQVVIISGPFGHQASLQDERLAKYSELKTGTMHPFFQDHLKYGLPEVEDTRIILKKARRVKNIRVIGEYFNLSWREKLMKLYISRYKLQFYFYLKGLMPMVPFLLTRNKKPCYRTLLLIKLD